MWGFLPFLFLWDEDEPGQRVESGPMDATGRIVLAVFGMLLWIVFLACMAAGPKHVEIPPVSAAFLTLCLGGFGACAHLKAWKGTAILSVFAVGVLACVFGTHGWELPFGAGLSSLLILLGAGPNPK